MNSIRDELVAFDTNVFIFALRKHPSFPACQTLVFDELSDLKVYIPLQIFVELQRNLHSSEVRVSNSHVSGIPETWMFF